MFLDNNYVAIFDLSLRIGAQGIVVESPQRP